MNRVLICGLVVGLNSLPVSAAAQEGTHACYFNGVLLPCVELSEPVELQFARVWYEPTKWIPLWPGQSLFGGQDPDWNDLDEADVNMAWPILPSDPDAENWLPTMRLDFSSRDFTGDLVRPRQSGAIDYGTVDVVPVEWVFRGDEVLDAWLRSTEFGIICDELEYVSFEYMYSEEEIEGYSRYCAFTRFNGSSGEVQYCWFEEEENGVRSEVSCELVATAAATGNSVLASRYVSVPQGGAGGEEEITCVLPGLSPEEGYYLVDTFLTNVLGKSSRLQSRLVNATYIFRGEGLDIDHSEEAVFLRIYLKGYVQEPNENTEFFAEELGEGTLLSFGWSFTVSAQSSEDIVDYREPNQAMGDRLRNWFMAELKAFAAEQGVPTLPCTPWMI